MVNNTNAYVFVNNDGLYISRSSKFLDDGFLNVELLGFTTKKSFVMIFDDKDKFSYKEQMAGIGFTPIYIL